MYDVVVVGGGAAGLSGAMALGRSRRSVLVIDAGEPRNAPADHAHNYLGREGVNPLELLEIGRAEVAAYGVEVLADRVVGLSGEVDDFLVTTAGGRRVRARRVLVTGGVVDELPDVPGLAERWGIDVLHCPYCHGWEVRDQRIAVLATTPMAGHQGAALPPAVRRRGRGRARRGRDPARGDGEAGRHRRPLRPRHTAAGRRRR